MMRASRRLVQLGFLLLVLTGVYVVRGNAERWCPLGGIEAAYTYIAEGDMICSLGVSNLYILAAVLVATLLLRRAFCGYMCPIGTISEWLGSLSATLGLRPARLPRRADRILSLLKYPILAVILLFTYRTAELVFRGYDPCYALISRHGEDIKVWAYLVAGAIAAGSLLVTVPFCRWLCPLAAALNPCSRVGLARISRVRSLCAECGHCAAACPMAIPVDEVDQVTAARCTSCLECVRACPKGGEHAVTWGPPPRLAQTLQLRPAWSQTALVAILLLCTTAAVTASYAFPLPSFVKSRGTAPPTAATLRLEVHNLTCRGRANLLMYYLDRDDAFALPGYLKLEAWPGPGAAQAHITYDPARCNEARVKRAITEPYYDAAGKRWRTSPFDIVGYDPFDED